MARTTQEVGRVLAGDFTLVDSTTKLPITGLVDGDFVKRVSKDGANIVLAFTITEVGNGRYAYATDAAIPAGQTGRYAFFIQQNTYNPWGWTEEFDVVEDTYQAKVVLVDDNANTRDRYVVSFFKGGQPLNTGITNPKIQVIKGSDGSNLIALADMTQIGTTGRYKYDEATARVVDGAAYIARVQADINGASRTWDQPVGRDS